MREDIVQERRRRVACVANSDVFAFLGMRNRVRSGYQNVPTPIGIYRFSRGRAGPRLFVVGLV